MADLVWIGGTSTSFTTAANWSPASAPVDNDNLIFDGRAQNDCSTNLSNAGTDLTSIRIKSSFTRNIGLVTTGALSRLVVGCTTLVVGEPEGDGSVGPGSSLLAFNFSGVANTTRVLNTASVGTNGFAPLMLKGTGTNNVLIVYSGFVGYATDVLNETSTLVRVDVLGQNSNVELGGGCTLTTINQTGGVLSFRSAVTTFDQQGGTARSDGSGTITTATIGGEFVSNSTGTITTATVINGGNLDLSQNTAARTITTTIVRGTGILTLPSSDYDRVTFTNGIDIVDGALSQQLRGLTNVNLALAAP
jgi:trimeric autotransporter adhesin